MNGNELKTSSGLTIRLTEYLLESQLIADINELFLKFIQFSGGPTEISKAYLVYENGFCFERISYSAGKIKVKELKTFRFLKSSRDFLFRKDKEKIFFFKNYGTCKIQAEVAFKNISADSPETFNSICHSLLNQVFLLLKVKQAELFSKKNRDDLTRLYNQNFLKQFINSEIERSIRFKNCFAVAFLDLDNLRDVNEKHGHLIGTEILKEVSEILLAGVRKIDFVSRFGGDEFVIVLLNTDLNGALDVCSRLRGSLSDHVFLTSKKLAINITGCFGISQFPDHGNSAEELIRKSDLAMYEVKNTGKNGINIYKGE